MKSVDIVRHGAAAEDRGPGNLYSPHAPLSEQGIQQSDALAAEYRRRGVIFARVYTSPLPRAQETAERLPRREGTEVIIADGLAEPDWGELVGRPFASFPVQPNGNGFDLYAEEAGQEPFPHVSQRVRRDFGQIVGQLQPEEQIAVVAHGAISKLEMDLLRHPSGTTPQSEHDLPETDQLANAQANHIVLDDSGRVISEERIGGRR